MSTVIKTVVHTGIYTFEIETSDEKELFQQVSFLSKIESACPICGAEVRIDYRSPQGFAYYGRYCMGPIKHEKDFSQNKPDKGGGLFDRENEIWHVALTPEEWKRRAQGGESYKCEHCGTNDNSAHRKDCPNNNDKDKVHNRSQDDTKAQASPGRKIEPVDEDGPIQEYQVQAIAKIYMDEGWDLPEMGDWSFKKAAGHLQKCQEAIKNASA